MNMDHYQEIQLIYRKKAENDFSPSTGVPGAQRYCAFDIYPEFYKEYNFNRILDIGPGGGDNLEKLTSIYPDAELHAWDIEKSILQKYILGKFPNIKLSRFALGKDDLQENLSSKFDFIIATSIIPLIPNEEKPKAFRTLHELLSPGGLCLVSNLPWGANSNEMRKYMGKNIPLKGIHSLILQFFTALTFKLKLDKQYSAHVGKSQSLKRSITQKEKDLMSGLQSQEEYFALFNKIGLKLVKAKPYEQPSWLYYPMSMKKIFFPLIAENSMTVLLMKE